MKWEFDTILLEGLTISEVERSFNGLGSESWELVSVNNGVAFFKRPVDEAARNRERTKWSEDKGWYLQEDEKMSNELDLSCWTLEEIEKHFIIVEEIGGIKTLAFRQGKKEHSESS